MPASEEFTRIKLMRGSTNVVENWVPEQGEPMLDLTSGTLSYGDGTKFGGIAINTMTSKKLEPPVDLNTQLTWGRFFVDGRSHNLPNNLLKAKYFLTVQSSEFKSPEILQEVYILEGPFAMCRYQRLTLDGGATWSTWHEIGGFQSTNPGTFDNDPNLDNYILASQSYVTNLQNGPLGSDGGSAFILVYRSNPISPYVFQRLIITSPVKYAGRIFFRFSVDGNATWEEPGYNWREILGAAPIEDRNPDLTLYY